MTDPRSDTPERTAERARLTQTTDQLIAGALNDPETRAALEAGASQFETAARRIAATGAPPTAVLGLVTGMVATRVGHVFGVPR